jgi:UDP-N-acetylglucosamine 2-epimerase (non-hydrolysing)
MKICIVLGTRPEIIKMASIIRYCEENKLDYYVIHTNQHYSENMDKIFFDELELPHPKYNIGIGSGSHGEMTGRMMIEIEKIFMTDKPDVVLVEGDTNSVLAGALVASKMGIKVGHVEAGLRSYDRTMPEELNRIMTDHISDYLFCPTDQQKETALKEGIDDSKIFVTGNTVVDAVFQGAKIAERNSKILSNLALGKDDYIMLTSHRPATVDNEENLALVLEAVKELAIKHDKKVVFPAHPRTKAKIEEFGIELDDTFVVIEPVGYLDMIMLMLNAFVIVTDSGGIQEEACVLERKTVVIRENTERPEAVEVGGAVLAGNSDKEKIVQFADSLIEKEVIWANPFGDGKSGERILSLLKTN